MDVHLGQRPPLDARVAVVDLAARVARDLHRPAVVHFDENRARAVAHAAERRVSGRHRLPRRWIGEFHERDNVYFVRPRATTPAAAWARLHELRMRGFLPAPEETAWEVLVSQGLVVLKGGRVMLS